MSRWRRRPRSRLRYRTPRSVINPPPSRGRTTLAKPRVDSRRRAGADWQSAFEPAPVATTLPGNEADDKKKKHEGDGLLGPFRIGVLVGVGLPET